MRPHASAALIVAWSLFLGCGGSKSPPSPVSKPGRAGKPTPDEVDPGAAEPGAAETALPADLPEQLEIEVRHRTEDGADRVLKLTPAGARYGLSRGKARIALRYLLPDDAVAPLYATLRDEGFDRLKTVPREGAPLAGGTSLRVSTGSEVYTASALGKQAPAPEDAEAYARCIAAAEELVPAGRSDVVVVVRWDASMRGQSAGLDVDVGRDLVGLHRVTAPAGAEPEGAGAAADSSSPPPLEVMEVVELHLARARPLQLQLRQGGPSARSTTLTVQAGADRGIELAFDAARGEVVARPLLAAAPSPATP